MTIDVLRKAIREIPGFPKPGVLFRDITPVLQDPVLFRQAVNLFCERHRARPPDVIAVIEARGFLLGSAVAYELGCSLVPIRKKGKLPYNTLEEQCTLEYGTTVLCMHTDAIKKGARVLLLDDLLATGGTAAASVRLIEQLGGHLLEANFLIELAGLKGRAQLKGCPVYSAVIYEGA